MASTKSTIAITLAALAAGAALGILFAPDSGKQTRKKISKKGGDIRDKLAAMANEGKGILKNMKNDAEELAAEAKSTAKHTKENAAEIVREAADRARAAAKN